MYLNVFTVSTDPLLKYSTYFLTIKSLGSISNCFILLQIAIKIPQKINAQLQTNCMVDKNSPYFVKYNPHVVFNFIYILNERNREEYALRNIFYY